MRAAIVSLLVVSAVGGVAADAATTVFFNSTQVATPVASGATWDSVSSNGYVFKYTRDKLFTGGGAEPIGRQVRVPWPTGVEAQAVTAGPNLSKARFDLSRLDGSTFDLTAFTAKLLANTAGAGGSIEVMPKRNGEDAFADPVYFSASGYYGSVFTYDESTPSYVGNTSLLKGYDTYTVGLYVDFALIGITFFDASIPPVLRGDYNIDGRVDAADYVVVRDGWGTTYMQADLDLWRANFGAMAARGIAASTNALPEPNILTLPAIMACWLRSRRRPV